jgi:hypothetical protein
MTAMRRLELEAILPARPVTVWLDGLACCQMHMSTSSTVCNLLFHVFIYQTNQRFRYALTDRHYREDFRAAIKQCTILYDSQRSIIEVRPPPKQADILLALPRPYHN